MANLTVIYGPFRSSSPSSAIYARNAHAYHVTGNVQILFGGGASYFICGRCAIDLRIVSHNRKERPLGVGEYSARFGLGVQRTPPK
jgi:hypothetical protein